MISFPFDHPRHQELLAEGRLPNCYTLLRHPVAPPVWLVRYTGDLVCVFTEDEVYELTDAFDEMVAALGTLNFAPADDECCAKSWQEGWRRYFEVMRAEARQESDALARMAPAEREQAMARYGFTAEQRRRWSRATKLSRKRRRALAEELADEKFFAFVRRHAEQLEDGKLLVLDVEPLSVRQQRLLRKHFPDYRTSEGSLPDPLVLTLRSLTGEQQKVLWESFASQISECAAVCFLQPLGPLPPPRSLPQKDDELLRLLATNAAAFVRALDAVGALPVSQFQPGGLLATAQQRAAYLESSSAGRVAGFLRHLLAINDHIR